MARASYNGPVRPPPTARYEGEPEWPFRSETKARLDAALLQTSRLSSNCLESTYLEGLGIDERHKLFGTLGADTSPNAAGVPEPACERHAALAALRASLSRTSGRLDDLHLYDPRSDVRHGYGGYCTAGYCMGYSTGVQLWVARCTAVTQQHLNSALRSVFNSTRDSMCNGCVSRCGRLTAEQLYGRGEFGTTRRRGPPGPTDARRRRPPGPNEPQPRVAAPVYRGARWRHCAQACTF